MTGRGALAYAFAVILTVLPLLLAAASAHPKAPAAPPNLTRVDGAHVLFARIDGDDATVLAEARDGAQAKLDALLAGPVCDGIDSELAAMLPLAKGSRLTVIAGSHGMEGTVSSIALDPSVGGSLCGAAVYKVKLESAPPESSDEPVDGLAAPGVLGPKPVVDFRHPSPGASEPLPAGAQAALSKDSAVALAITDLDVDGSPEILTRSVAEDRPVLILWHWTGTELTRVKTSPPWGGPGK
jgi:hypothetical protein